MQTLRINGYDMSFVEHGEGIPLVLVHGSLADCRWWDRQAATLGLTYRVVAPSLRHAWPERWRGEGDGFTIAQHVADVSAFIAARFAGPVHLLGLSRGGHVAFRVAPHHPRLVRALVLAEPSGALDTGLDSELSAAGPPLVLAPIFVAAAERIRGGEVETALKAAIDAISGAGAWDGWPETARRIARDNAGTLLGQMREQRAPFSRADAEAISAPTLLIDGARSPAPFRRVVDGLQRAIPTVTRATIPAASHCSNIDNPEAFDAAVLAFLKDH